MPVICPTITALNKEKYLKQLRSVQDFASQIHIDLMDGLFTTSQSLSIDELSIIPQLKTDIHVMYMQPIEILNQLIHLKPNLVIVHFEAQVNHADFAKQLKSHGIKAGLAILQETPVSAILNMVNLFDQVLVFAGHLGYQGGVADLSQITKVNQLKALNLPIEISWDGGINDQNAKQLVDAGVNVLNVGSYIQSSSNPKAAYDKLLSSLN